MQPDIQQPETLELLQNLKNELNITYSQLRNLITSFRVKLEQPDVLTSVIALIDEFNKKLRLNIELDYQCPYLVINSHQSIHLLQIMREVLNNIYKHAKASKVKISFKFLAEKVVELKISDNGIGLANDWKKEEHYGLTIIKNRVDFLNGFFHIESEKQKGVTICINFKVVE